MNKKRSAFYKGLYDSLKFYGAAFTLYEKTKHPSGPIFPDLRGLEELKIFNIARSYEALSKAYLAAYGFLVVYPSFVISVVKKGDVKAPRHFQKELISLSILIRQSLNLSYEETIKKLGHDPLGRSHLPALLRTTAKFEQQIGERELASFNNKVADFLSKKPNERRYSDLVSLRKESIRAIQFREIYSQLFEILKKCVQNNSNDEICKNLTDEDRRLLALLNDKPYLLDQIIIMLELSFQELYDAILYTAYLARAAEIADYTIGRNEDDEKYLAEVMDHQQEVFDFLSKMQEINMRLIKDDQLDEFMSQLEELSRSTYSMTNKGDAQSSDRG